MLTGTKVFPLINNSYESGNSMFKTVLTVTHVNDNK